MLKLKQVENISSNSSSEYLREFTTTTTLAKMLKMHLMTFFKEHYLTKKKTNLVSKREIR